MSGTRSCTNQHVCSASHNSRWPLYALNNVGKVVHTLLAARHYVPQNPPTKLRDLWKTKASWGVATVKPLLTYSVQLCRAKCRARRRTLRYCRSPLIKISILRMRATSRHLQLPLAPHLPVPQKTVALLALQAEQDYWQPM